MKRLFFILVLFVVAENLMAQSVGIGTTTPAASAQLEITSSNKGLLIPRITKTQKNAIASPATGLLVYQTGPDSTGFHYYTGTGWLWLEPVSTNAWKTKGNAGTDTAVNFIGTTDNMPLAFMVNNEKSGRIESSIVTANTFLGFRSGRFTTGNLNTAIGNRSMAINTTGSSNVAIGAFSLTSNQTGSDNAAIGDSALNRNLSGENTAVGSRALANNTIGAQNTSVGSRAGYSNTNGFENTSVGANALKENVTGILNTVVGANALSQSSLSNQNAVLGAEALTNRHAQQTTAIGQYAGYRSSTTLNNVNSDVFIGFMAGINTLGDSSTFIGNEAGSGSIGDNNVMLGLRSRFSSTGSHNLVIGNYAGYGSSGNNSTHIGNYAGYFSNGSNSVVLGYHAGYGASGDNCVYIGQQAGSFNALNNLLMIDNSNTSTPLIFGNFATNLLRVNGTLNINNLYSFPAADGTPNQVLRTNGAGVVNWATLNGESTTASNGLTLTSNNVALGGTLLDSTTISQGASSMVFNLNGAGDFYVRKNSGVDGLMVSNTGNAGIGTNTPENKLEVLETGTNQAGMFTINNPASSNDVIRVTTNGTGWAGNFTNTINSSASRGVRIATTAGQGGNGFTLANGTFATSYQNLYISNTVVDDATIVVTAAGNVTIPTTPPLVDGAHLWVVNNSGALVTVTNTTVGALNINPGRAQHLLFVATVSGTNWIPAQ
jgi:hypothetical protein